MDFIDPDKRRKQRIQLLIGYVLIATAVVLATIVLLFLTFGYSFGKNGQIIQNGLVFVSSAPNPAKIYLNGVLNSSTTNTRLQVAAGQYTMELTRDGYRPWVRSVGVEGGSVERFDYPLLFPTKLVTTNVREFTAQPALMLQSPNKQWLLLEEPGSLTDFDEYDLSNPKQLTSTLTTVSIPSNLLAGGQTGDSLQLVGWSNDNQHVLLKHVYNGGSEYILLDRQTPADSVNLTKTLNLSSSVSLSLINGKYNQYYEFDNTTDTLATATLSNPTATPLLSQVISFVSYGSNTVLYATAANAPSGDVDIDVSQGGTNYVIQQIPADSTYLLSLAQYSGDWYVAVGSPSENKVYVYEDPMSELSGQPKQPLVPVYILKVYQPTYVAFSANFQFVMAEGGQNIAVYDAENQKGYSYTLAFPVAAGQNASWMDGDRLLYVNGGKLVVWDYDHANQQTLQSALDGTTPIFDPAYQWSYALAPASSSSQQVDASTQVVLTSTALLTPADQ